MAGSGEDGDGAQTEDRQASDRRLSLCFNICKCETTGYF